MFEVQEGGRTVNGWIKPTRQRESGLQSMCREYAELRGWFCEKTEGKSKNGFPDFMFIRKGRVVFVEFKRDPDEEPTTQQKRRHRQMREHGAEVHVIDNFETFCELFR